MSHKENLPNEDDFYYPQIFHPRIPTRSRVSILTSRNLRLSTPENQESDARNGISNLSSENALNTRNETTIPVVINNVLASKDSKSTKKSKIAPNDNPSKNSSNTRVNLVEQLSNATTNDNQDISSSNQRAPSNYEEMECPILMNEHPMLTRSKRNLLNKMSSNDNCLEPSKPMIIDDSIENSPPQHSFNNHIIQGNRPINLSYEAIQNNSEHLTQSIFQNTINDSNITFEDEIIMEYSHEYSTTTLPSISEQEDDVTFSQNIVRTDFSTEIKSSLSIPCIKNKRKIRSERFEISHYNENVDNIQALQENIQQTQVNNFSPQINIHPPKVNIQQHQVNILPSQVNIQPPQVNVQSLEVNVQLQGNISSLQGNIQPFQGNIQSFQRNMQQIEKNSQTSQKHLQLLRKNFQLLKENIQLSEKNIQSLKENIQPLQNNIQLLQESIYSPQENIQQFQEPIYTPEENIQFLQEPTPEDNIQLLQELIYPPQGSIQLLQELCQPPQGIIQSSQENIQLLEENIQPLQEIIQFSQENIQLLQENIQPPQQIIQFQQENIELLEENIQPPLKISRQSNTNRTKEYVVKMEMQYIEWLKHKREHRNDSVFKKMLGILYKLLRK